MTREKILEALFTIQKVCETRVDCATCPLRNSYDKCTINNEFPTMWSIKCEEDWTAFEN